jgi:hypothetical protein
VAVGCGGGGGGRRRAALDGQRRPGLSTDVKELLRALAVADTVVALDGGRIVQEARPPEVTATRAAGGPRAQADLRGQARRLSSRCGRPAGWNR